MQLMIKQLCQLKIYMSLHRLHQSLVKDLRQPFNRCSPNICLLNCLDVQQIFRTYCGLEWTFLVFQLSFVDKHVVLQLANIINVSPPSAADEICLLLKRSVIVMYILTTSVSQGHNMPI